MTQLERSLIADGIVLMAVGLLIRFKLSAVPRLVPLLLAGAGIAVLFGDVLYVYA